LGAVNLSTNGFAVITIDQPRNRRGAILAPFPAIAIVATRFSKHTMQWL
jgi:hypothetical protein